MGYNLCLHFGADEHPCTTYFDVHQGYGVVTHSHFLLLDTPETPVIPLLLRAELDLLSVDLWCLGWIGSEFGLGNIDWGRAGRHGKKMNATIPELLGHPTSSSIVPEAFSANCS